MKKVHRTFRRGYSSIANRGGRGGGVNKGGGLKIRKKGFVFIYKNCTKPSKICTEIKKLGQNVTDLENIYGNKFYKQRVGINVQGW